MVFQSGLVGKWFKQRPQVYVQNYVQNTVYFNSNDKLAASTPGLINNSFINGLSIGISWEMV